MSKRTVSGAKSTRPHVKEVATKTVEQQTATMPHKVRDQLVWTRTGLTNMIRGLMSEFGIIAATGQKGMAYLLAIIVDENSAELSTAQRAPLMATAAVLAEIEASIRRIDALVHAHAKSDPNANRLMTLRGVAEVVARAFAASLGLTPKISGTRGSVTLGAMSKRGNGYLRRLLYLDSASRLAQAIRFPQRADPALTALLARMPFKKAAIMLANKTARIICALLVRGGIYENNHRSSLSMPKVQSLACAA